MDGKGFDPIRLIFRFGMNGDKVKSLKVVEYKVTPIGRKIGRVDKGVQCTLVNSACTVLYFFYEGCTAGASLHTSAQKLHFPAKSS